MTNPCCCDHTKGELKAKTIKTTFFASFKIKCIGLTLVNTIILVSSVQFYDTFLKEPLVSQS